MIDNTSFLNLVSSEQREIQVVFSNPDIGEDLKHKLLEYSLVRCVVQFQQFISVCFDSYASGESSISGYIPERKLEFENAEHLHKFFLTLKKGYIDTFENGIKDYSKHIFRKDPFALIMQDSTLWNDYNEARIIRNYLMHQSGLAEKEYREKFSIDDSTIIEPWSQLLTIKNRKSLYKHLTDSLANITTILVNPTPYF